MSFCLFGLCVVQSKYPQAPRATAEKMATRARLRAKQAIVSSVRFILCPLFVCFAPGFPGRVVSIEANRGTPASFSLYVETRTPGNVAASH